MSRYFVGLTGASGHLYAQTLLRTLLRGGHEVDLSITSAGCKVLRHELGIEAGVQGEELEAQMGSWLEGGDRVRVFPSDAVEAPAASGTSLTGGVILCPCSMGTLARVSVGFSSNLVERAADVALKEGRPLLVMPRETPLSEVHLENLLRLAKLGAAIVPCAPGFYHHPESVQDLVDHVVGKALDRLGVEHDLGKRWQGFEPEEERGIE